MIKLFRIILAALLICTLTLSYQGISQKPGGSVIKTERAGLSGNCSEAKEEKFSWKDITLIVFGIGIIVLIIINAFLYYRIKRYKEQGFYQGHSAQLLQTPDAVAVENGKSEQERDQLLQTPDAVAVENDNIALEKEQLKKENEQLKKEKEQLKKENEQLKIENEQLKKENEQLKKENEQLKKENEQLKKENEQLKIENEQLKKENEQLKKENEQLKKENEQLKKDYEQLKKENEQLKKENEQLKKEKEQLKKENEQLKKENEQLTKEKEELKKENEQLKKENEQLKKDYEQLKKEKEQLKKENEQLKKEKEQLKKENEQLKKEKEQFKKEIERRKAQFKSAWRDIPLYADWRKEEFQTVNLTLDAATAHPALFLSEEGRRVTWQEPCQELPSCPERFVSIPCVLGQLHVSSERYFWEVEVQDTHSWDLGVCRNNVAREGRVTMSPQNGFWAIRLYDGEYWGLTSPETSLTLKEKLCRVGVFLDYKAGDVSFYNMTDGSHIYTFSKQAFYGGLRPLFRLWSSDSGPLTIVHSHA